MSHYQARVARLALRGHRLLDRAARVHRTVDSYWRASQALGR